MKTPNPGSVAERSKAAVLKTADPAGSGGSNPSASEEYQRHQRRLKKVLEVLPSYNGEDTLEFARLKLANDIIGKGTHCTCCGKYARITPRPINSTMARSLIWLVKASGPDRRWVDWQEDAPENLKKSNQVSTLKHAPGWVLVESRTNTDPEKKNSGWWRPTKRGVAFVMKQLSVKKRVHTYNDMALGFSGPNITIEDALGTKFHYTKMMSSTYSWD